MRLVLTLISLIYGPCLYAQNWFEVEILLFRQNLPGLTSPGTLAETWPDQVNPQWASPLVELADAGNANRAMRAFSSNARQLNNDAFALRVTSGYELLWHQAWLQPMTNEADAPWIRVGGGDTFGGRHELEGNLRIHLARFLHLTGEFWLTDFGLPTGLQDSFRLSDLPDMPNSLPACSHLRYQPPFRDELAPPPTPQQLEQLERMPSWWKPPYDCLLPRELLALGAPLAYAPHHQSPEASVEVTYLHPDLGLTQQQYLLPPLRINRPAGLPLPLSELDYSDNTPVRRIVEIQMDRRMRSGETHFIDHPLLGMLIRILPVPEPEPAPEPATADLPAQQ